MPTWSSPDVRRPHRALVTGASGFVGRALVRRLRREGFPVVSIGRSPSNDIVTDITDQDRVADAVDEVAPDVVFHLAATGAGGEAGSAEATYRVNVAGTRALTLALRRLDEPPRVIAVGSLAEYGAVSGPYTMASRCEPTSVYGATKLLGTETLRLYSLETDASVTVLRSCDVYGPGRQGRYFLPTLMSALAAGVQFEMSPGEQLRDYVHVDDLVDALVVAARVGLDGFCVAPLGSGEPVALAALARMTASFWSATELLSVGAFPYRRDEQMAMYADASALADLLGWRATRALEDGLRELVEGAKGERS